MKIFSVSKCSLDIKQYVELKMSVLISPSKSLISLSWVTFMRCWSPVKSQLHYGICINGLFLKHFLQIKIFLETNIFHLLNFKILVTTKQNSWVKYSYFKPNSDDAIILSFNSNIISTIYFHFFIPNIMIIKQSFWNIIGPRKRWESDIPVGSIIFLAYRVE